MTRSDNDRADASASSPPRMKDLLLTARKQLEALTGRPVDSVSSVRRCDDGWQIIVDVVELERVPATTSVLGSYEVTLDADGEVIEFGRTHRFYRNHASTGDE